MGNCCSNQEEYDPNKTLDKISSIEPLVNRTNIDPNLRKVDNEDIVFQKIDISASSSDNIDKKELDDMMKTDDEFNDVDENEVVDEIEEEEEEN